LEPRPVIAFRVDHPYGLGSRLVEPDHHVLNFGVDCRGRNLPVENVDGSQHADLSLESHCDHLDLLVAVDEIDGGYRHHCVGLDPDLNLYHDLGFEIRVAAHHGHIGEILNVVNEAFVIQIDGRHDHFDRCVVNRNAVIRPGESQSVAIHRAVQRSDWNEVFACEIVMEPNWQTTILRIAS
jgi:hypothetical protein